MIKGLEVKQMVSFACESGVDAANGFEAGVAIPG